MTDVDGLIRDARKARVQESVFPLHTRMLNALEAQQSRIRDLETDRDEFLEQRNEYIGFEEKARSERDAPSPTEIRAGLIAGQIAIAHNTVDDPDVITIKAECGKQFDRWLAAHDDELTERVRAEQREADAREIRAEMARDELALNDVMYEHQLPQLSRVMLNGATRFAERLTARSASFREAGKQ